MSDPTVYSWHKKTWDQFVHAYQQNHLPHAIMVSGTQGIGKQAFAQRMSKFLLCLNSATHQQACGECEGCKTYESGANPDFLKIELLEDKQQISVDQIREVSRFLTLSRSFEAYRVILINQIERMNLNAANSLLKSLEEPANNTVIILTTNQLSKILPTIISRSQLLALPSPSKKQATEFILSKKAGIDRDSIEILLEISAGSPLIALEIDQNSLADKEDFEKDIIEILTRNKSITDVAKKWEKHDQATLLDWQLVWLQNLLKKSYIADFKTISIVTNLDQNSLWKLYQALLERKKIIHTSVNPLINLESVLSLWVQATPN